LVTGVGDRYGVDDDCPPVLFSPPWCHDGMKLGLSHEMKEPSEPGETGREGVKMVAVWILLVVVFFVLTRGTRRRR